MIDALFGSKTRVKLLHLFLNNPGQPFYVREITRKIDEQINSVRRELSNMMEVGIITSDSADNRLYYQVNQNYEYYAPLKRIFGDKKTEMAASVVKSNASKDYQSIIESLDDLRLVVFSGKLVGGSSSKVDILIVGSPSLPKVRAFVSFIEKTEDKELDYSVLPYEDFYYRLSVRDKFITEILNNRHKIVFDPEKILTK